MHANPGFQTSHQAQDRAARLKAIAVAISRVDHHHRNPNLIGHAADFDTVEVRRHDADDREAASVDKEGLTDDVRIAAVNSPPESISDHGNCVAVRHGVFVERKKPSEIRPQSEHRKIAA